MILNGRILPASSLDLEENTRQRPAIGIFETMLWEKEKIFLMDAHFQRLEQGLSRIGLGRDQAWSKPQILDDIHRLLSLGGNPDPARIRLHVFRSAEQSDRGQYSLEAWSLDPGETGWNARGYRLGWELAPARTTPWSGFKFSPDPDWEPLERRRREMGWDDIIRCDESGITETPKANIFLIEGDRLITPPLSVGCVHGLMRAWLNQTLKTKGWEVKESPVSLERLLGAEAIFLTNAVRRIQWVEWVGPHLFPSAPVRRIHDLVLADREQD